MQEFLDFVLRQLIDYPDDMILTKLEGNKKTIFKLQLRQSDVGKVIGKHGQTIIAIRNLLAAAAARHGERAILEIVEDEAPRRYADRAPVARAQTPKPESVGESGPAA
ncbi:MAG: KH domain-containing protein [Chthoniobacteraceae bacterium]